eukprot:15250_1
MFGLFVWWLFPMRICHSIATTPPRGWNSWDSYLKTINETQMLNNAKAMKTYLKPFGYEYVVIDGGWEVSPNGTTVSIDEYGRLQPDPTRFPHGFAWLSYQIHSMGLKFGIHTNRGIYIDAVNLNASIYGTNNTAFTSQILYDPPQWCRPNDPPKKPFQSVDISKYGGQQYYNSMYDQFCNEWNIDFVKFDCVFGKAFVPEQIIAAQDAIIHYCNKNKMVYSLSPGDYLSPEQNSNFSKTGIYNDSNMYRITGDTWDEWTEIIKHFNVTSQYHTYIGGTSFNGYSWPDLDMLPLGYITTPGSGQSVLRYTNLTYGQQRVVMTLWCIARSPLVFGGEMTMLKNDSFTLDLITNKYVLEMNYNSSKNRQVSVEINPSNQSLIQSIWSAEASDRNAYYVAMFNLIERELNMSISFMDLGINSYESCQYYSVWNNTAQQKGETKNQNVTANVPANDVALYYLNQCK